MKICIFTATGAENLGDELITVCQIRYFQKYIQGVQIIVFSHDITRTKRFLHSQELQENIELQEYFPNKIRKNLWKNAVLFWRMVQTISRSDRVYVWWGGLLYNKDEDPGNPLVLWWLRAKIIKFLKKPITYLSVWITAHPKALKKFSSGLFKNSHITVRDIQSQETLKTIGYASKILPDPVTTFQSKWTSPSKKMIGIALRKWYIKDSLIAEMIHYLSRTYTIVLLPHSLHPEDEKSHDGYYMQQFLFPGVLIAQTIEQTLSYYSECHIIMSMRLHSMVLAMAHHRPFIAMSYSHKTDAFLQELQWKYRLDENMDHKVLLADVEENYEKLSTFLLEQHQKYTKKYQDIFPTLCS